MTRSDFNTEDPFGRPVAGRLTETQSTVNAALGHKKQKAKVSLQSAVRRGKVIKPDACQRCGKKTERKRLHRHHSDYGKPWDVEWLCQPCHHVEDFSGWKRR